MPLPSAKISLKLKGSEPELSPEVTKSGFSGKVNVEVSIDENGNVVSASYVSGNSALKFEAEEVAR